MDLESLLRLVIEAFKCLNNQSLGLIDQVKQATDERKKDKKQYQVKEIQLV